MISSIVSKLKGKKDASKIVTNVFALYLNNAVNYVLPLIIVPYLIKVLGLEYYGYYVFAFALASYFKTLINFGFEITITKYIVKFKNDNDRVNQIFSLVLCWRAAFFLISAVIFLIVLNFIPIAQKIGWTFFILNFLYVFSAVLALRSYYYVYQEIKFSTIANAVGKGLYLICLLLFVKSKEDYLMVAFLSSMSWILPSIILFINGYKRYNLEFKRPKFSQDREIVNEAKNAFLSQVSVNLYSTTNVFILGLAIPGTIVGVYGSLERVYSALTTLISSSNYIIYPRIIKYYEIGKDFFYRRIKYLENGLFLFSLFVCLILFALKPFIIQYIFGGDTEYADIFLTIFLIAGVFSPFGAFYTRCLLIKSQSKTLLKVTSLGFVINFIALMIIIYVVQDYRFIPVSVLITKLYISLTKRWLVHKKETSF